MVKAMIIMHPEMIVLVQNILKAAFKREVYKIIQTQFRLNTNPLVWVVPIDDKD
jgi:hypothetical protein